MTDITFFLERVVKQITEGNSELGECWLWTKATDSKGRPVFTSRKEGQKFTKNAVREIYKLTKMPDLPPGRWNPILHRCKGQYGCINPDHLYYVSDGEGPKQNRTDAIVQQQIPPRKLKGKIDEIVKMFQEGVEQKEIAKRVGVCDHTIMRFLNGRMNQFTHNYIKEAEDKRNALIKKLYEEGRSLTQIMNLAQVPQQVVYSIVPEIRERKKGAETAENKALKATLSLADRNQQIKEKRAKGQSVRELAQEYNVSIPLIYTILKSL